MTHPDPTRAGFRPRQLAHGFAKLKVDETIAPPVDDAALPLFGAIGRGVDVLDRKLLCAMLDNGDGERVVTAGISRYFGSAGPDLICARPFSCRSS